MRPRMLRRRSAPQTAPAEPHPITATWPSDPPSRRLSTGGVNGVPLAHRVFPPHSGTTAPVDVAVNARHRYRALFETPSVTVEWGNWIAPGIYPDTTDGLGTAAVTAAIEHPAGSGVLHEARTPAGVRTAHVEAGGRTVLEVACPLQAGDWFDVRLFARPGPGTALPTSVAPLHLEGCGATQTDRETDRTLDAAHEYPHEASTMALAPSGIFGTPAEKLPIVAIAYSDSIAQGVTDSLDDLEGSAFGFLERALVAGGVPHVNLARVGDFLSTAAGAGGRCRRSKLTAGLTDVVIQAGTNDILRNSLMGWSEGTRLIDDCVTDALEVRPLGARIWVCTVCPRPGVASEDAERWCRSTRTGYHAWLRDGCPLDVRTWTAAAPGAMGAAIARCDVHRPDGGLRSAASGPPHLFNGGGVFDPGRSVEAGAEDSNVWKPGLDADDLIHPNPDGHAVMAGTIDTTLLS